MIVLPRDTRNLATMSELSLRGALSSFEGRVASLKSGRCYMALITKNKVAMEIIQ